MSLTRTAWTDDSGSGTDGTILNNAEKTALYDQIDARWSEITITAGGALENLSITTGGLEADVLRCNNSTGTSIRGIVAPAAPVKPAKRLIIYSVGGGQVDLEHEAGTSTAANRILNTVTVGPTTLAPGKGVASAVYDSTAARWRLTSHEQGTWIAFTPGFTNLTVGNGSVVGRFLLKGSLLIVEAGFNFGSTSSIAGAITMTLPATYSQTTSSTNKGVAHALDSGTNFFGGVVLVGAATTVQPLIDNGSALVTITSTTPFTWATGDNMFMTVITEVT